MDSNENDKQKASKQIENLAKIACALCRKLDIPTCAIVLGVDKQHTAVILGSHDEHIPEEKVPEALEMFILAMQSMLKKMKSGEIKSKQLGDTDLELITGSMPMPEIETGIKPLVPPGISDPISPPKLDQGRSAN